MKGLPKMKETIKKKLKDNLPDTSLEEGRYFNLENKTASKDNLPTNLLINLFKPSNNNSNDISKEISKKRLEKIEKTIKDFTTIFTPTIFVRYPFFVSTSKKKRKNEIFYTEERADGTKVKWEIEAKNYLPGEMEYKVWCWLLHRISGIPKPLSDNFYIPYSLYKIAKFWNLDTDGTTLNQIKKAIKNLRTINIYVWLQPKGKNPVDLSFTIFAERYGRGKKINDEIIDKNVLFLSLTLIALTNKGIVKPLDGEIFKKLIDRNILSARLYEILGWRFYTSHRSKKIKFLYDDLINRIGLSEKKYLSEAKRQLENANKWLIETGIIKGNPKWKRIKDTWSLTYNIGGTLQLEMSNFSKGIEYRNTEKQLATLKPHSKLDDAMGLILETVEVEGKDKKSYRYLVNQILQIYPNGIDVICKAVSTFKQALSVNNIRNPNGYLYAILKKSIE